jgi:HAD superfamily hydrolase (TIGR01459 family)
VSKATGWSAKAKIAKGEALGGGGASNNMTIQFYKSVSEFAGEFDAFIIDLWGVLHDGTAAYPGAIENLKELRAANKKVILLSNAPRQAHKAAEVLLSLGFTPDLYDDILTSGQATHDYLRGTKEHGTNYYYIGPEKDLDLLADLQDYTMVDDPKEADFVIATGFDGPGQPFEAKQEQIDTCLENKLLLICPNPDKKVVKMDGRTWLCPGVIADYYHEQGGEVISIGKPYSSVYEKCFEMFGGKIDKSKICAIGDSLHTDIAGANAMGIFSVLCAGGILAKDLEITQGQMPDLEKLQALCERENATPEVVISSFIW